MSDPNHPHSTSFAPLPTESRLRLESIFQTDLSHIHITESHLAERHGTNAVATGNELHFSSGAFRPSTTGGLFLLAHELTHTFQQQELPPSGQDNRLLIDPALEAQADQIASLVVSNPYAARQAVTVAFPRLISPRADMRSGWVQPNVHVMSGGKDTKLTNVDQAMRTIQARITDHEIADDFLKLKLRIRPVLEEWISASRVLWKRWLKNKRERTVQYPSWDSLARALLGEVRSQSNLTIEAKLARDTASSAYIHGQLAGYLSAIHTSLSEKRFSKVKSILLPMIGSYSKQYGHWYPKGGMKKILTSPAKCEFKHLVAGIHDIVSAFSKGYSSDWAEVPDDRCKTSILVPNLSRGYNIKKVPMEDEDYNLLFRVGSLGSKHCTLIEESEIIQAARDWNMPVGFGPSFTTGRTLQCCESFCNATGVGTTQRLKYLSACTWGLFAFWNLYYERRYSRAHTFHEAMDMSNNYGVPYNPFHYPDSVPSTGEPFPLGDLPG